MKTRSAQCDPSISLLEKRESQLWWLAVLVMLLLGCAVSIMDWTSALQSGNGGPLAVALNTKTMRVGLMLSVLAISAYFRDSSKRLRRTNNQLINELEERTVELRRKNVEIAKLKELSDELINLTDLPKALELALDMALSVVGADTASIMLREKGSDLLRIVAARGLPEDVIRETRVPLGEALSGIVAESGKALILNSDDLKGRLKKRAQRGDELVSAIIVPIDIDAEVRGVINASRRRGSACFSEDEARVLSTLANQSALVLRKIELWEDVQQQVTKLEEALLELKQTQGELVQSAKLASIGQLAGGMAHEINNPLQVIAGRIELLLEQMPPGSAEERQMKTVLEHAERISAIVSGLLRFARRQPEEETDSVVLDDGLREAVKLLGNQMSVDNVKLDLDLQAGQAAIIGSRVKIEQVFMNLLINAYQAMRKNGGRLNLSSRIESEEIVVQVADTGPGIPSDLLPHIFEPFFTTKEEGEGTGLGLSVTYGIVESHGGRISVESELGKGATFMVRLPLAASERKAAA